MDCSSSQASHKVEHQKLLRSPHPLQRTAENKECPHIEEQVSPTSVHEHVSNRLPPMKERRRRVEKGKLLHHQLLVERGHYHHQYIDEDDVLYCLGDIAQKSSPSVSV